MDTLFTTNLGELNEESIVLDETLTATAPNDIFQFTTKSVGNINIALTNISENNDADLQLFRDDGDGIFETTSDDVFISTKSKALIEEIGISPTSMFKEVN